MVLNLDHEFDYLKSFIHSHPTINLKHDWKLLHLLIGANDMCYICHPGLAQSVYSPDKYELRIRSILSKIQQHLPRTIVNVVHLFSVSGIHHLTKNDPHCKKVRTIPGYSLECSCVFMSEPLGLVMRRQIDLLTEEYNRRLKVVVDEYQRNATEEFAVTSDEAFWGYPITNFPLEAISDIDCFHPSQKMQQVIGASLWYEPHI
jgi:phospholipase B1